MGQVQLLLSVLTKSMRWLITWKVKVISKSFPVLRMTFGWTTKPPLRNSTETFRIIAVKRALIWASKLKPARFITSGGGRGGWMIIGLR